MISIICNLQFTYKSDQNCLKKMNENDRQKITSSHPRTAFEIRRIKKNYLLFSLNFCNLNVSLFAFSAVLIWNLIFQQIPGTFFSFPNYRMMDGKICCTVPSDHLSFCVQTETSHKWKKARRRKSFSVRISKTVQCLKSFCRENGGKRQLKIMRLAFSFSKLMKYESLI